MQLTAEIKQSVEKSILCWLATSSPQGEPNVSPKEIFCHYEDQQILVANIASPRTVKNIKSNPKVCISFIDILVQKGFQLKGEAEVIEQGDAGYEELASPLRAQNTEQLNQWAKAINHTDTQAIENTYRSDALVLLTPESVIEGSASISKYWQESNHKILNPQSLFHTVARENRGIEYELVTYSTSNGKSFTQLLIWQKTSEMPSRQLEYTARITGDYKAENEKDIEARRLEWIKRCNEHNARHLVEALYSDNTLYYNHKPLVNGGEDVIHEYGYMNNERYSLSLHPLHIEYPSADTAIEIGQCKGSYGGKYILVWKKEKDGIWRILMDSNV